MACSEDCEYYFISLLGEFSEGKAKTKDLNEKLNVGLNSSLIHCKVVIVVRIKSQFCNHHFSNLKCQRF